MKKTFLTLILVILAGALLTACYPTQVQPFGTPIPTLIPAQVPTPTSGGGSASLSCSIQAVDLLGAWVSAGSPESAPFDFTDDNGQVCQGRYSEDVHPLFAESNLWFRGAQACTSCHGADVTVSMGKLDLSSFAGILAGSKRASAEATGSDILGGGDWESSKLYEVLVLTKFMPLNRPADMPEKGPRVYAGAPK